MRSLSESSISRDPDADTPSCADEGECIRLGFGVFGRVLCLGAALGAEAEDFPEGCELPSTAVVVAGDVELDAFIEAARLRGAGVG